MLLLRFFEKELMEVKNTKIAITNKNLELLFSGQNLRQFSFAFQFAPRNNSNRTDNQTSLA